MNDLEAITSDSLHELAAPREHLRLASKFFGLLILASLYLAVAFSLWTAALTAALAPFLSIPLAILVSVALLGVAIVLRSYGDARHAVKSRTKQIELNHAHARYLELANLNLPQTISSDHALLVNNKTIGEIDLDNRFPTRKDLDYFIDQVDFASSKGLRLRDWLGRTMPSDKVITTIDDWHMLLDPFVRIGAISEPSEAKRTKVLIEDAARVRYLLNQAQAEAYQKQNIRRLT